LSLRVRAPPCLRLQTTHAFTLRCPHSSSRLPSRACALTFLWLHARVLAAASLARASLAVASRACAPPCLRLHTRASLLVTASLARAFLAVGSARMCAPCLRLQATPSFARMCTFLPLASRACPRRGFSSSRLPRSCFAHICASLPFSTRAYRSSSPPL
jgi:hypothetical protein